MTTTRNKATLIVFLTMTLFFLVIPVANANQITDIQRGVYAGYELLVIYYDSLSQTSLQYDRVLAECRVDISQTTLSERTERQIQNLAASPLIKDISRGYDGATLVIHFHKTAFLRTYMVTGPTALMIDISPTEDIARQLPYELSLDTYLAEAEAAERMHRYEVALPYIEHIRNIEPNEPDFTHRAGIIQHKLKRFDAALASFASLCNDPRYAADVRARRAMIYLAMGDTTSSGREWATYFHGQQPAQQSTPVHTGLTTSNRQPLERQIIQTPPREVESDVGERAKEILKAGESSFKFIGWSLLLIGALVLIKFVFDSRNAKPAAVHPNPSRHRNYDFGSRERPMQPASGERYRKESPINTMSGFDPIEDNYAPKPPSWEQEMADYQEQDYQTSDFSRRNRHPNFDAEQFVSEDRYDSRRDFRSDHSRDSEYNNANGGFSQRPTTSRREAYYSSEDDRYRGRVDDSNTAYSQRVSNAYKHESRPPREPQQPTETQFQHDRVQGEDSRIPVSRILDMAAQGQTELEIARSLNLGRDEVSMVINLAKLAGKGETV